MRGRYYSNVIRAGIIRCYWLNHKHPGKLKTYSKVVLNKKEEDISRKRKRRLSLSADNYWIFSTVNSISALWTFGAIIHDNNWAIWRWTSLMRSSSVRRQTSRRLLRLWFCWWKEGGKYKRRQQRLIRWTTSGSATSFLIINPDRLAGSREEPTRRYMPQHAVPRENMIYEDWTWPWPEARNAEGLRPIWSRALENCSDIYLW